MNVTMYFLPMIKHLRMNEEVLLYQNLLVISEEEEEQLALFLKEELFKEAIEYPYTVPSFDKDAALWASKLVYYVAQLVIYREHKIDEFSALLVDYQGKMTPDAVISADLTLRFLPMMLVTLQQFDTTDSLIPLIEQLLTKWHYSGINYDLPLNNLDFSVIVNNPCLQQLYANRIVECERISLAKIPLWYAFIGANLGMFSSEFWNEFYLEQHNYE